MVSRVKVLLVSTIVTKSLREAIESVKDYCDVILIPTSDLPIYSKEELQNFVDWADYILLGVMGDPGILKEIDYRGKDVVVFYGGSTLMGVARLGSFRMPKEATSAIASAETLKKRIEMMQKIIERLGAVLPVGVIRDGRNYVRIVRYWLNGGFKNYKNMFLYLCRLRGVDVDAEDPEDLPEYGYYDPEVGLGYRPSIDPSKPAIGILFYGRMLLDLGMKTVEALAREFRRLNYNVVPVFSEGILNLNAVEKLLELRRLDAVVSLLWFTLDGGPMGGDPRKTVEMFKRLGVKLFTPITMYVQRISDWEKSERGVNPVIQLASVVLPEVDGACEPVPVCGISGYEVVPLDDRVKRFVSRVGRWVELRVKPNKDKRVAIVIYNYPPGEENLGKAAYLDVFKSLEVILNTLRESGYSVPYVDDIGNMLVSRNIFNVKNIPLNAIDSPRMSVEEYLSYFSQLDEEVKKEVVEFFGPPPGAIMVDERGIVIPALVLGNIAIVVQPARTRITTPEDLASAIHDKTKPPHHQYLATYLWIQKVFRADAVIHLGTHGTAEFTKGKEVGLSSRCYPDILIGDIPNIYVYHVSNVAEATIAKRRLYATIVSHNSPPYTLAGLYGDYQRLEDLLHEYRETLAIDRSRAEEVKKKVLELAERLNLGRDIDRVELKLHEFKNSLIPRGLHAIGKSYGFEELKEFALAVSLRKLTKAVAEKRGFDIAMLDAGILRKLEEEARKIFNDYFAGKAIGRGFREILDEAVEVAKKFTDNTLELRNLLEALNGGYIEPSPGGDPARNPEVLPTGRNIYQLDPRRIPTEGACERGRRAVEEVLNNFYNKYGRYPETVGVVLWGFETAHTYGETVAQILEYLGVEIVHKTPWEKELRVRDVGELKRPRIDVVVTICGFFREMFPNIVELLSKAFELVASLDEPEELNYIKKHNRELKTSFRIFGPRPTEYGTRVLQLVEDSAWASEKELVEAYTSSMGYAYGRGVHGVEAIEEFRSVLRTVEVVSQIRSTTDYEITDLDHYYEFLGGLSRSVEELRGQKPVTLVVDSASEDLKVEDVRDSVERGAVTRILNPVWIEGMLKHGYLGVQKICDRVSNLLGLAATTGAVDNWVWDRVAETYILDEEVFEKLKQLNTYATYEIVKRLLEAEKRGYWRPSEDVKRRLEEKYAELDSVIEDKAGQ